MADNDLVMEFIALFRSNESAYGQFHFNPRTKEKKKGETVQGAPSFKMWNDHIDGRGPIMGGIPILDNGMCYYGAIDYDDHECDLFELEEKVREFRLPCILCRSRRGGAHFYTFTEEGIKADQMILKMREWLGLLQLRNPDGRAIEIFPKQSRKLNKERKGKNGKAQPETGNWINLPYYGMGADQYAIHEGQKLDIREFLELAEQKRMTAAQFKGFFPTFESELFADGPPCCAIIHEMGPEAVEKGNNYLFNVAVFFKAHHPDDWQEQLEEYNESLDDPLRPRELAEMVRQHEKVEYSYMCKQMPIAAHCYKTLCKKRKFGIGHVGKALTGSSLVMPELKNLTKIKTDPPKWLVEVNGEEVMLTTQDLLQMQRFQQAVLEQVDVVFPILKRDHWQALVDGLMQEKKVIHAPEDAGIFGQFKTYLQSFLCQYRRSEGDEGLLKGFPVKIENRIYFRAADLHKYLRKEHSFTEYPPNKLWLVLRKLNIEYVERYSVAGKSFPVWHVDESVANEQKEDFKQEKKGARVQF